MTAAEEAQTDRVQEVLLELTEQKAKAEEVLFALQASINRAQALLGAVPKSFDKTENYDTALIAHSPTESDRYQLNFSRKVSYKDNSSTIYCLSEDQRSSRAAAVTIGFADTQVASNLNSGADVQPYSHGSDRILSRWLPSWGDHFAFQAAVRTDSQVDTKGTSIFPHFI